jgi:periplasmic protein TonB
VKLSLLSTLHWALGVSVAVHTVLLTARFVDPDAFNRVFEDAPLEVILVNARSNEKPDKAKAIAQANMAGGGDVDKGRATSPLPPSAMTVNGDDAEDSEKKVEAMHEQQTLLLAQIRSQLATLPPQEHKLAKDAQQIARENRRRQLTKLLAEIERRINEENARPKKRYISPATQEKAYALYYDAMRRRIEDRGTENFPQIAGNKLYGALTITLTVNHDGKVLEVDVVQTSGNTALDRRALAIAKSSGPFGMFTTEMRKNADQLVLVSQFRFTRDETLETKITTRSLP